MPQSINEVHILGHAGKDAESKYVGPKSTLVIEFSIATGGGKKKGESGNWPTEWHTVRAWKMEHAIHIRKGQTVEVWGRLKTESWDDKATGVKRYKTVIVAQNIEVEGAQQEPDDLPVIQRREPQLDISDEDIPF